MADPLLISLVDDEEPVRRALCRLLASAGMRVQAFASGAEFLGSLPGGRPDCLVIDMHMPGLTGFDILRRLGNGPCQVPAVAISGKDDTGMRSEALALGASAYLTKPLDVDVLLDAVQQAVGR